MQVRPLQPVSPVEVVAGSASRCPLAPTNRVFGGDPKPQGLLEGAIISYALFLSWTNKLTMRPLGTSAPEHKAGGEMRKRCGAGQGEQGACTGQSQRLVPGCDSLGPVQTCQSEPMTKAIGASAKLMSENSPDAVHWTAPSNKHHKQIKGILL